MYEVLNKLNINYDEIQHIPIYTVEDASKLDLSGIEGIECKCLFVKSKSKYYLVFMRASDKCNLKDLANLVNDTKLTFASIDNLNYILKLDIGGVTPLGIINDTDNKVILLLDSKLEYNKVLMHTDSNTKTISMYFENLIKVIEYTKHKYYKF